jgi:hypothetical protein
MTSFKTELAKAMTAERTAGNMNLDILICTPDSRSERFKRCYDSLQATTRGITYNLIVRDNRGNKNFNHALEISKTLAVADGDVITLDDDVELTGAWLEAMLDAADNETGIVATTEYKTPELLWRRGWYCDSEGKPLRWNEYIAEPQCVPAVSSCCMLITKQTRHPGMNRYVAPYLGYKKYYFDPDMCLCCWRQGLQVKVIPERCIHCGQGAILESGVNVAPILNQDRALFKTRWLDSGIYDNMKREFTGVWPKGITNA